MRSVDNSNSSVFIYLYSSRWNRCHNSRSVLERHMWEVRNYCRTAAHRICLQIHDVWSRPILAWSHWWWAPHKPFHLHHKNISKICIDILRWSTIHIPQVMSAPNSLQIRRNGRLPTVVNGLSMSLFAKSMRFFSPGRFLIMSLSGTKPVGFSCSLVSAFFISSSLGLSFTLLQQPSTVTLSSSSLFRNFPTLFNISRDLLRSYFFLRRIIWRSGNKQLSCQKTTHKICGWLINAPFETWLHVSCNTTWSKPSIFMFWLLSSRWHLAKRHVRPHVQNPRVE